MGYAGLEEWPEPPIDGDEVATLLGSLDRQRGTFAWKSGGLDAAGLAQRIAASSLTLGGLLKHLAHIEDHYFSERLFGLAPSEPWNDTSKDTYEWDWTSAASDTPEYLYALWQRMVDQSRRLTEEAIEDGGLSRPVQQKWPDGSAPSLRRTMIDLIEEYARHVGQADLLREAIDGVVGEDPPGVHG